MGVWSLYKLGGQGEEKYCFPTLRVCFKELPGITTQHSKKQKRET